MTPLPVTASIKIVKKKPNMANLPFQFSAEVVKPQTQGKKPISLFIEYE